MSESLEIGGTQVLPGTRSRIEIPVARLATETWLSLPVEVMHGKHPGPRLWISAAVHGDELNGVEVIRRLLRRIEPRRLTGSVIAVPIVNLFGFINQSRYLPDRRDLNRCFPGSNSGSLASRLAHLFIQQIVTPCTHGIDLHTGSNHRTNLPQIRANLKNSATRKCAMVFGAPVIIDSQTRDGSLREAAARMGKPILVYEAGEPLRFDEDAIKLGVRGVLRVMELLGMRKQRLRPPETPPMTVKKSSWARAKRSGFLRLAVKLGDYVAKKQTLGTITDAFGDDPKDLKAPFAGLVIGHTNNPLVYQGDAVIHLAEGPKSADAS